MELIEITPENLDREHICCAISEKKGEACVASKKAWLRARMAEGLVFRRLDERGKVFIEYLPAEAAWCPLEAADYLFIDCLWVSGQFKGRGWGAKLLESCIGDARRQGKAGVCAVSSAKKRPFLSDPGFFKRWGFQKADEAPPWFELYYLPLREDAATPRFKPCARQGLPGDRGLTLYYCDQCPHTGKYAQLLGQWGEARGVPVRLVKLETGEAARSAPTAFPTYSLFRDGVLVTNEVLSEKAFQKLLGV